MHMAQLDVEEPEWIRKVKSEGAIPLLDSDNYVNGWASPPGESFLIRGPEYFTNKVKIPGSNYLLKPLGFDLIKGPTKLSEILNNTRNRIRRTLDVEFHTGDRPFVWAFNLQLPSKENYSAVAYFVNMEPVPEGSLVHQFMKGDDAFRTSRLKLIANVVKGPWIVRRAVGEQAICVIGRALTCKYCVGENFIEVDIDVGSSVIANAIVHLAFGYLAMLKVDLAFLIESQTESELPEQLLGAIRFSDLDAASAWPIELTSHENDDSIQSSLSKRLWKSLGNGLSSLIHPAGQEDSGISTSQHLDRV